MTKCDISTVKWPIFIGIVFITLSLASWVAICSLNGGFGKLVFLLAVVQVADAGSYLGGMLIGKHRLTIVSPKKTWEGLLIGIICALGAGMMFHYAIAEYPPIIAGFIAGCLICMGVLGDLLASALKRLAKIKDFSNILPGHGGILDRIDSYIFSSPVAWCLFCITLDKSTGGGLFLLTFALAVGVILYIDLWFTQVVHGFEQQ